MKLINKIAKLAGKENFEVDDNVGIIYIIRICIKYGSMKIRGFFVALGKPNIDKSVFIGKSVKLVCKKNLIIGSKVKIHSGVEIDALARKKVIINDNVIIGDDSIIKCTGSIQHVGEEIEIGARTSFGNNCFFGCAGGVNIGEDVIVGQYVRFHSENHRYENKNELIRNQGVTHRGIKIGNNCWVGSGVVFLDGVEIGNGCVVAANAVVTKKFPDNCVIAGMPAKIIKKRGEE